MSIEDHNALMSSEIFRAYAALEMEKEAKNKVTEAQVLDELIKFENMIKENPIMLKTFVTLQKRIGSDPGYRDSLDSKFASAVMLLELED